MIPTIGHVLSIPLRLGRAVWADVQEFRRLRSEYLSACAERHPASVTIYVDGEPVAQADRL